MWQNETQRAAVKSAATNNAKNKMAFDRFIEIEKQNRILLQKMSKIM